MSERNWIQRENDGSEEKRSKVKGKIIGGGGG